LISCACINIALRLTCCGPVLDGNNRVLSGKVVSALSSEEAVRSSSVRNNRISPFLISINRIIYNIVVLSSDIGVWNPLPTYRIGIDRAGSGKVISYGIISCGKEGMGVSITWFLDVSLLISGKAISCCSILFGEEGRIIVRLSSVDLSGGIVWIVFLVAVLLLYLAFS
jgi:hypothetical protein